jgi:hypothetical protein
MGWPFPRDVFGGSFLSPMGESTVALGVVAGLDAKRTDVDVHALLQRWKTHPLVRGVLEGGECVEWGAKTIPEGGWWSIPERRQGAASLLGDAAGFADVVALKGIHHAICSGTPRRARSTARSSPATRARTRSPPRRRDGGERALRSCASAATRPRLQSGFLVAASRPRS